MKDFPVFRALTAVVLVSMVAGCGGGPPAQPDVVLPAADEQVLLVFDDNVIHFLPDEPGKFETVQVGAADNGREIAKVFELERPPAGTRILAEVTTRPIAKDIRDVHDKWDRAGNLRLSVGDGPDVELVKFVTAYGGMTSHLVDITDLAPLFQGTAEIRGFVDTWSSPGWEMDARIRLIPDPTAAAPLWARPLFYEPNVTAESMTTGPLVAEVDIPEDGSWITLHYLTSGHCTDGTGSDEFETKDHVIIVDGAEVYRYRPWRDDCKQFRAINPYCRRWSDGSWSADYSRSGWCPGDKILPHTVDLSAALSPGPHRVEVVIEDIRPKDEDGNLGYWRVSAYLTGRAAPSGDR